MDGRYKTWESKTLCRTENIKKSDRGMENIHTFIIIAIVTLMDWELFYINFTRMSIK